MPASKSRLAHHFRAVPRMCSSEDFIEGGWLRAAVIGATMRPSTSSRSPESLEAGFGGWLAIGFSIQAFLGAEGATGRLGRHPFDLDQSARTGAAGE
jgi:hypothetical protein